METAPASSERAEGRGFEYTQYEANAWSCVLLKTGALAHLCVLFVWRAALEKYQRLSCFAAGVKVLCDPWLTGDLVFAGQTWLYRGKKTAVRDLDVPAIGQSVDLLVLSQVRRGPHGCLLWRTAGQEAQGGAGGVCRACQTMRTCPL